MLQTFVNAWKIAELRKKLLYTALIVLVFRIGSAIPVPFTEIAKEGIIGDIKRKEAYEKPSVKRKKKQEAARKRKNSRD